MNIELKPKVEPQKTNKTHSYNLTNLPSGQIVEYFAKDQQGTLYIAHRPRRGWDGNTFKLYVGPENNVVEVDVTRVSTYRDGGSIGIDFLIDNQKGSLFFPHYRRQESKPFVKFNGERSELEDLL